MARGCHQGIDLSYRIDGSPQPLHGFRAPPAEGLNGEGHQTASGQRTGWIAPVLPLCGSSSRGPVNISRPMEPGTTFGVGDNNVPVHQRIRRRAAEPTVEPNEFELDLTLLICSRPGPSRLENLGRGDEARGLANPCENVPDGVVPPDNETPDAARERVEAVGVEGLRALSPREPWRLLLRRRSTALVPATVVRSTQTQGDSQPEARANSVLQVGEPCGRRGGSSKQPSPGTRTPATSQARPPSRGQGAEQASPSNLSSLPGEKALALGKGRSVVVPPPRLPIQRNCCPPDPLFSRKHKTHCAIANDGQWVRILGLYG